MPRKMTVKAISASLAMQASPAPNAGASCAKSGPRATSRPWSNQDSAELKRLCVAGHNTLSIAVSMGRSETTIKRWSQRLKLRSPTPKRPWTPEDEATLHHGIQSGIGLRTIALTLGRTYAAVQVHVAGRIQAAADDRAPQAAALATEPVRPDPIVPLKPGDLYTTWLGAMRAQAARYPNAAGTTPWTN
jgi:hypothetical protein